MTCPDPRARVVHWHCLRWHGTAQKVNACRGTCTWHVARSRVAHDTTGADTTEISCLNSKIPFLYVKLRFGKKVQLKVMGVQYLVSIRNVFKD